jgi:iron complex transport system substrate-binding protein
MKNLLLILVLLVGVSHAKSITDDYGNIVEVPDTINSIYIASPPITMSLLAFDPSLIVALNSPWLPIQEPFVGAAIDKKVAGGFFGQGEIPNYEILALSKPDVILLWGRTNGIQNVKKKLEMLGIPVLLVRNDTINNLISQFKLYGELTGNTKRANELIAYTKETLSLIDSVQEKLATYKPIRYYFAQGIDGLFSECAGSFHLQPFNYAGATNALDCKLSSNFGMEKISPETIMMADPDVIIAMEPSFYNSIKTNPHFASLRAVKEGKVYLVPTRGFNFITRPPSFMRLMGIRWLIHTFYPNLLKGSLEEEQIRFDEIFFKNLP